MGRSPTKQAPISAVSVDLSQPVDAPIERSGPVRLECQTLRLETAKQRSWVWNSLLCGQRPAGGGLNGSPILRAAAPLLPQNQYLPARSEPDDRGCRPSQRSACPSGDSRPRTAAALCGRTPAFAGVVERSTGSRRAALSPTPDALVAPRTVG